MIVLGWLILRNSRLRRSSENQVEVTLCDKTVASVRGTCLGEGVSLTVQARRADELTSGNSISAGGCDLSLHNSVNSLTLIYHTSGNLPPCT